MDKVLVGLSGGVDSAVAAYLLKAQGYDVTCAFMRNWDSATNNDILGNPTLDNAICTQEEDFQDAQAVAKTLDLPLLRIDFIEEYWDEVFQSFLNDYEKGRTPNPDILCNKYIKFHHFWDFAQKEGFNLLATGHYAKLDDYHHLTKADDRSKDQSYFLCQISNEVLQHTIFPLGNRMKKEVRQIAHDLSIPVAEKKDSTGICFIGERNFQAFLSNYLPMKEGNIIFLPTHQILGRHQGVFYYTIGQRKGLNIGGTGPYFVCGKNIETNELFVTNQSHMEWITSDSCLIQNLNWLKPLEPGMECTAKFRYRQKDIPVQLEIVDENSVKVSYPQGSIGVTPGQEAVIYSNDYVIVSGTIETIYREHKDLMQEIISYSKESYVGK